MKYFSHFIYKLFLFRNRQSMHIFLLTISTLFTTALQESVTGQEAFIHEESPAPLDVSDLEAVDVDPEGRMVAVGRVREWLTGGSPFFPLIMIKDNSEDPWTLLDPPDFGFTYHQLKAVKFVPGTDGDFVAVGGYYPDILIGYNNGMIIRYYKSTESWAIHSFVMPGAHSTTALDAVFDPADSSRLMICGVWSVYDPPCFEFTTMVLDYNINTYTYSILPTTQRGALWSIEPLPNGNFLSAGPAAGACDYLPYPLIMEVEQGIEIIHPIPPPATNGYFYDITAITALDNGQFFMVGHESPLGGSDFSTLSYKYDPAAQEYTFYKPLDPDSAENFTNQFWALDVTPNGLIYAVGRTDYMYDDLHYRKAMIQSFDGEIWRLHPIPTLFNYGYVSELWGMTSLLNNQVYAVGKFRYGSILYYDWQTLVMHNEIVTNLSDEQNNPGYSNSYSLSQNYPNPFNPTTKIKFWILDFGFVSLKVYDILGSEVATLINEEKQPGVYEVGFDASALTSGLYLYQLRAGSFVETKKMILLR